METKQVQDLAALLRSVSPELIDPGPLEPPLVQGSFAIRDVPVELIDPSPFQTRVNFSQVGNLAESLREEGLNNPILLRPNSKRFEVVAGECRLQAVKALGRKTIPARIEQMSDAQALKRVVVDNEQRTDLNLLERARSYKLLSEPPLCLNQEQISKLVGKSQPTVSLTLSLLEQPIEIQKLVEVGKLGLAHVQTLSQIANPEERIELAKRGVKRDWSVTRTALSVAQHGRPQPQPKATPAPAKVESVPAASTAPSTQLAGRPVRPIGSAVSFLVSGLIVASVGSRIQPLWLNIVMLGIGSIIALAGGVGLLRYAIAERERWLGALREIRDSVKWLLESRHQIRELFSHAGVHIQTWSSRLARNRGIKSAASTVKVSTPPALGPGTTPQGPVDGSQKQLLAELPVDSGRPHQ